MERVSLFSVFQKGFNALLSPSFKSGATMRLRKLQNKTLHYSPDKPDFLNNGIVFSSSTNKNIKHKFDVTISPAK